MQVSRKAARNSKSTENTNPFLFDLSPKDLYKDTPLTKAKGDLQQQEGDSIRGRRMSLDVLKAPFAWNRRRRTNSVATTTDRP
ncbi:hypothetical protein BG005_010181 [Podila minutissima]|nr:hypothetical protein BG005_010181 [Podila minutissima]